MFIRIFKQLFFLSSQQTQETKLNHLLLAYIHDDPYKFILTSIFNALHPTLLQNTSNETCFSLLRLLISTNNSWNIEWQSHKKNFFTSKLEPTIFRIFFNYLFTHNMTEVRMFVFVSLRVTRANARVTSPVLKKNPHTRMSGD